MNELELCERLGFAGNPFQYTNAALESLLPEYFVPPPYFPSVWGDSKHPIPVVVLAPRGSGKTAQRRMVEHRALSEGSVLPVSYNRFEFGHIRSLNSVTLSYHVTNLCRLVTVALLLALEADPHRRGGVSTENRRALGALSSAYLADLTNDHVRVIAESLQPLGDKLKERWNSYLAKPISQLFKSLTTGWGWPMLEPDLQILGQAPGESLTPSKAHLVLLSHIAQAEVDPKNWTGS